MYTATATESDDRLIAVAGGPPLNGLGGDDWLYGSAGNDDLDGGAGADRLEGRDGDDVLRVGAGNDSALGGLGSDTLVVDFSAAAVQPGNGYLTADADPDGGYRGLWGNDDANNVFFSSIEHFDVRLGAGHDYVVTGDGNDRISGGGGSDRLHGGAGDDLLDGGESGDDLTGGAGNDIYIIDDHGDRLIEEAGGGRDEVRIAGPLAGTSSATSYTLPDEIEDLTILSALGWSITASAADNRLRLGDGNDGIDLSHGGDDRVEGGGGNDALYFAGAYTLGDSLDGGAGHDTLFLSGDYSLAFAAGSLTGIEQITLLSDVGSGGNYALTMHDGNVAAGSAFTVYAARLAVDESLVFNGAAETGGRFIVTGGLGADTITGGAGADTITGGGGADHLRGGRGADTFRFADVADSAPLASDIVYDFEAGDRLNLAAIDADGNAANGDTRFGWIGGAAFSGTAGELRATRHAEFNRAWAVEADVNGDAIADFSLIVVTQRGYDLTKGDFWM
jgi:Ca2+-binding RTX toxin-like protein